MTPAELCERAVERLETTGWKQGSIGTEGGPNCLVGAFLYEDATRSPEAPVTAIQMALRDAVASYVGNPSVPDWNDQPDRTIYEVIDAVKTVGKMFANGEITMDPA